MLPETAIVTGEYAFPCYDHDPMTTRPPLTNGGTIRAMDNHQLSEWLAELAGTISEQGAAGQWGPDEFFRWLSEPVDAHGSRRQGGKFQKDCRPLPAIAVLFW